MTVEAMSVERSAPIASTSKAPPSIFASVKEYPTIREGSLVIVYLSRDSLLPITVHAGETTHTRYGSYSHSNLIGKVFGSKIYAGNGRGFCHVLRPTPELWSISLPHRTQILYLPDIAYISAYLDIKPGSRVVEAGTGSGSFSHSLARTVGTSGKVFSFEFHEPRYEQAKVEFENHGLSDVIELRHRNVCKDGFKPASDVDSVFLDVPAPWEAIDKAKEVLARDRMTRICCFSPCIEQVSKTVTALQAQGFSHITMYETLVRQHDAAIYQMPTIDDAIDKLRDIESRKKSRKVYQKQRAMEEKAQLAVSAKRKADQMEAGDSEAPEKKVKAEATDENEDAAVAVVKVESEVDGQTSEPAEKKVKMESADVKTEEGMEVENELLITQQETSLDAAKEKKMDDKSGKNDWRTPSMEERRYLSTKPAPQTRGHTSYLTFAFLMPEVHSTAST